MPDMVPFDGEAADLAVGFLQRTPFAPSLHHAPKPEVMDPLPPINKRGGRTVGPEGWRTVYSVMVTEGECAQRSGGVSGVSRYQLPLGRPEGCVQGWPRLKDSRWR
jgi:acyl-coenzyme A thioesterase 13